jgi:hypothetical protein
MRSNTFIEAGNEIFASYGDDNGYYFFLYYGFVP